MTKAAARLARTIWDQAVACTMLFATWPTAFALELQAAEARRDRERDRVLDLAQRQHRQGR